MKFLRNPFALSLFLGGFAVLAWNSLYTVDQTKQAIVLQFGELRRVVDTPGLKLKVPFIQDVIFYEKRVLDLDSDHPVRVTSSDQKRLWVDSYTRYRIADPLLFYQTVKPASELGAQARLEVLISSAIRNVLGKAPLRHLLSEERTHIMHQIQEEVSQLAKGLGLAIIDVRIIRAELPSENRKAVFARMNSDLQRLAKENRAKGAEAAQSTRADADKEKTVILAEAYKTAEITRGDGEAKAAEISAKAYGKDPKFYNFYRTMQIYRETLSEGTTLVLSSDSELLKHLESVGLSSRE